MISKPIPWDQFEVLMRQVRSAAHLPGNEHLYRYLVFCALTAYGGLRTQEVRRQRWMDFWFPSLLRMKSPSGIAIKYIRGNKVFYFEMDSFVEEILKESYQLARIVVNNHGSDELTYRERFLVGSLQSCARTPMTIQALDRYLEKVTAQFGGAGIVVTPTALRKTYARRQYDINGRTDAVLSKLKSELGHSSLALTMKYIS